MAYVVMPINLKYARPNPVHAAVTSVAAFGYAALGHGLVATGIYQAARPGGNEFDDYPGGYPWFSAAMTITMAIALTMLASASWMIRRAVNLGDVRAAGRMTKWSAFTLIGSLPVGVAAAAVGIRQSEDLITLCSTFMCAVPGWIAPAALLSWQVRRMRGAEHRAWWGAPTPLLTPWRHTALVLDIGLSAGSVVNALLYGACAYYLVGDEGLRTWINLLPVALSVAAVVVAWVLPGGGLRRRVALGAGWALAPAVTACAVAVVFLTD